MKILVIRVVKQAANFALIRVYLYISNISEVTAYMGNKDIFDEEDKDLIKAEYESLINQPGQVQ